MKFEVGVGARVWGFGSESGLGFQEVDMGPGLEVGALDWSAGKALWLGVGSKSGVWGWGQYEGDGLRLRG